MHQPKGASLFMQSVTHLERDASRTQESLDLEIQSVIQVEQYKDVSVLRQTIGNYVNLIKPHVTVLLLGITVATMAIAKQSLPSLWLVLATLLGGVTAAG